MTDCVQAYTLKPFSSQMLEHLLQTMRTLISCDLPRMGWGRGNICSSFFNVWKIVLVSEQCIWNDRNNILMHVSIVLVSTRKWKARIRYCNRAKHIMIMPQQCRYYNQVCQSRSSAATWLGALLDEWQFWLSVASSYGLLCWKISIVNRICYVSLD